MPKLAVNIDHIATIREARKTNEPDPLAGAFIVEQAGADGLVVHIRQDRRHIQERDLDLVLKTMRIPVNLEMAPVESLIKIALEYKPFVVTLVPENQDEVTTEGGLDLAADSEFYKDVINRLKEKIQEISLFIDPSPKQIEIARLIGTDYVELHSGMYAGSTHRNRQSELERLRSASEIANKNGLMVRIGHGLTYLNVQPVAKITQVMELSIGHSIVSRAIFVGLFAAVKEMVDLIK
jgi:pyridoxine 5-phosphate synthase